MRLIIAFVIVFSFSVSAAIDVLNFNIRLGKYHKGGTLDAQVFRIDEGNGLVEVLFNYDVKKRPLVPASPDMLKNSMKIELPIEFLDERGYLALERDGSQDLPKARLEYLGRVQLGKFRDAHQISIKGKNGKFDVILHYHPALPELGWGQIKLILNVVLLKNYEIVAELK